MRNLITFLSLFLCTSYIFAQDVSKGVHQVIDVEEHSPKSLRIDVATSNVDIKTTEGKRLLVNGKVKLSIPNYYLLEHLVGEGRYELDLKQTPSGIELKDKEKEPITLRGQICREDVYFTIYVPSYIKSVEYYNSETGESSTVELKS